VTVKDLIMMLLSYPMDAPVELHGDWLDDTDSNVYTGELACISQKGDEPVVVTVVFDYP
jgi:hypothetical protein